MIASDFLRLKNFSFLRTLNNSEHSLARDRPTGLTARGGGHAKWGVIAPNNRSGLRPPLRPERPPEGGFAPQDPRAPFPLGLGRPPVSSRLAVTRGAVTPPGKISGGEKLSGVPARAKFSGVPVRPNSPPQRGYQGVLSDPIFHPREVVSDRLSDRSWQVTNSPVEVQFLLRWSPHFRHLLTANAVFVDSHVFFDNTETPQFGSAIHIIVVYCSGNPRLVLETSMTSQR